MYFDLSIILIWFVVKINMSLQFVIHMILHYKLICHCILDCIEMKIYANVHMILHCICWVYHMSWLVFIKHHILFICRITIFICMLKLLVQIYVYIVPHVNVICLDYMIKYSWFMLVPNWPHHMLCWVSFIFISQLWK